VKKIIDELRSRYRFDLALKATKRLIANKDDTPQAFRIFKALRGWSFERSYARFAATPVGQSSLHGRAELETVLDDHSYLRQFPNGSLADAYLTFCGSYGFTADGLHRPAAEIGLGNRSIPPHWRIFSRRLRAQHDIWHVVTGYGSDGLGEALISATTYTWLGNIGFIVVASASVHHYAKAFPQEPVWRALLEALWRGWRGQWLPGINWEDLLCRPLEEVRSQVGYGHLGSAYRACTQARLLSQQLSPLGYQSLPGRPHGAADKQEVQGNEDMQIAA
jgi:ubiquinone biosynthesis protein COQ4